MMGEGRAEMLLTGQRATPKRLTGAGFEFSYPDLVPALEDILGPK
jgi:NAD dependent epimerase/dehydratase family enzyme